MEVPVKGRGREDTLESLFRAWRRDINPLSKTNLNCPVQVGKSPEELAEIAPSDEHNGIPRPLGEKKEQEEWRESNPAPAHREAEPEIEPPPRRELTKLEKTNKKPCTCIGCKIDALEAQRRK
jgi:hypothetical protein